MQTKPQLASLRSPEDRVAERVRRIRAILRSQERSIIEQPTDDLDEINKVLRDAAEV